MIEDEELRNLYQLSSEEHLQELEEGLWHLQAHPNDEAKLEMLRREAHSLKGDSRSVGIESVETLAQCFGDILLRVSRQQLVLTQQVSDRLFQGLVGMRKLVEEAVTDQQSGVDPAFMLNDLMAIVSQTFELQPATCRENANPPQVVPSFIEDEELRNLYQFSSQEHLQQLESGLHHLQAHPDDEATLEQLRWDAHSLKGDSRSVGLDDVETLAHCFEEIFLSLSQQQIVFTQQMSDCLFQGLAAMSLLVQEALTNQPSGVDTTEVLNHLLAAVAPTQESQQETARKNGFIPVISPNLIEDEELREVYKLSSEERLQILQIGLQYLQQHHEDKATLERLRREAHTLKGDSKIAGVEPVETLSHQVEEILLSLKKQEIVFTPLLSDRLYQGLDVIGLLVEEAVTGQPSGIDVTDVLNSLIIAVLQAHEPQKEAATKNGNTPVTVTSFIADEELREVYKLSTQERLQNLEADLLHLEKQPNDEATLEQLLREAHSLKGDSRSVGVESVETLIHQVEEIFLNIKGKHTVLTPQVSDCLYQGLDAINKLVREAVTGQPSGVDTGVILNYLMEVVDASTIQESISVLPTKNSVKEATQDLPSVNEPYRIDTIRVPTRELDALMTQAEELTVTRISIVHDTSGIEELASLWEDWKAFRRKGQYLNSASSGTHAYEERIEKIIDSLRTSAQENSTRLNLISGELSEKISTLRLLPLSTLFQLFPRMVRDLARQQSKQVELIIEGGETSADKRILEDIKDALMHMIRNAIDHGIETSEEREALGKPAVATIWLRGYQSANNIVIEVTDDGRGLDIEKIKQTAIKRGLYQKEELEFMTTSQIHSLIFAPGFSTRTFITEISGRGIGLDVVRTNVERLKGNIQIESIFGKGCTFRLQLGTTLASINALLVEVQGIIHALPVESVQTTLLLSQDEIYTAEDRETIIWDDQEVPVGNLVDLLELSNSPAYDTAAKVEPQQSDLRACIVLQVGEERAGFFVDRLLDTQEVVLKPQSQLLRRVRNVSGATILGTGDVCMILNPQNLLKSLQNPNLFNISIKQRKTVQRKPVILLVEDSIPVRTQEQRLLENAGYEVVIAVDGLDGYNKLINRKFDAVLSDVEMPHLDGFSLTAKIRRHPEYRELPIILVTTLDSDKDKKKGSNAGADAYIIKGKFNQAFLLETLGRLV